MHESLRAVISDVTVTLTMREIFPQFVPMNYIVLKAKACFKSQIWDSFVLKDVRVFQ